MKRHHNTSTLLLLICLVLPIFLPLHAQPICQIQKFSIYNGLAQRTVTDIVQDNKGFIWLATWNGLIKYDGYTFKNYKAYPGDGCTLTSNRLQGIVQNQNCNIWCQTYDGRIYLFDSRQEKFIDFLQPIEEKNKETYTAERVYSLAKGVSWIVCAHGAFRIDEQAYQNGNREGSITFYSPETGNLPGRKILNIVQDENEDEWILTNKGTRIVGKKTMPDDTRFISLCENNRNMYLISEKRLAIYNKETEQIRYEKIPHAHTRLNSIQNLGKDTIGIGTDNGYSLFFAPDNRFKHVDTHIACSSFADISRIFRDSHHEIWSFSNATGVVRYSLLTDEMQFYQTAPQDMPKAERKSRDIFFEDNEGTLWLVPHLGCLSYYDRETKTLKPYYTDYSDPESKFTPVVLNYFIDKQNNFWYSNSFEMGKISFFPNACQLTLFDSGYETRAFLIDKDKNLWVANKKGFIRILHSDGSLKGYLTPEGKISSSPVSFGRNIYCFMEDKKGEIWLGSKWDGVFRLKEKGNGHFSVQWYQHKENDTYSLSNNSIYSICQDSRGRIWIGTYGGGLNLFQETKEGEGYFLHCKNLLKNYSKDRFAKIRIIKEVNQTLLIGTTEGLLTFSNDFTSPQNIVFHPNARIPDQVSSLSSNDVTYIYTDSRRNTYILTFTGGVNQIVSDSLLTSHIRFKTYTKREGLPSDLVLSMIEDEQQNLWIISENAIIKFNPESGSFDKYGKRYMQKEIYFSEAIPVLQQNQLIIGTEAGIIRIDPVSFHKSTYTPPIAFTGLKIQGVQQNLAIDDLKELRLEPNERNVSFQFAALDYIDPTSISYAYRLKGLENEWNEVDNSRTASYINLSPGKYELEIRSTNSDGVWADNVRRLPIHVIPTFWETYWAILFYALLFILFTGTIVYIILYIYRLRHQISLEHQLANIKLRFFTDISHELRTPLTLITSPVSEVLEHEPLSPNARKHLTLVHKNTERMLRLINQILDFRKIENKKMKLLLEKTEIIGLLQRVMEDFRLMAEEKNIHYRLETRHESIYAWIDQDKFEKIVCNLISNAFKYTPTGKSITVYADTEDGKLVISVVDEGIGIDPQKRQNLFQRFETLVRSNILQPSSGIGLSLVKELIELHQGSIEVNSQVGVGSKFTVALPLDRKAYEGSSNTEFILNDGSTVAVEADNETSTLHPVEEMPQEETGTEGETTGTAPVSILIVEDNPELKDFLKDILSGTYKVIEAANGEEGLKAALHHLPDLIISDVMMPVMDGLDMVKAIKEDRNICHIPIILLSAKSSLDDRISGLEQGIDDYITKPFSSTYLKTRIKYLLHQRKALQEFYLEQWTEKKEKEEDKPQPLVTVEPARPQIKSFDEQFMQQVMEIMEKNMDNSEWTMEEFAQELNMGRTVFYQKLKSIIGLSPVDFVREMRLKRAMQLIESSEYNISTIAYMTGFNDPKYFSKCFKKKYGMRPSEYGGKKE